MSVLRLALDVSDPVQRRRVESMFSTVYTVRRALQRKAGKKVDAYWAARHERQRDEDAPAATRARLGLSRTDYEEDAYAHVGAAPHLRHWTTKAQVMHVADNVWNATERHLFCDASGKRHGRPRVGRWHDFTWLPGRARLHTKPNKWETTRLHGTLDGHRAAYTGSDGRFFQPRRMRPVAHKGSWWRYRGPLALVFSGLPCGDIVLPVRLPAAPSNRAILDHFLGDPSRWHKIDLVRSADPNAPGGWRYEAHLMVLVTPYVSASMRARREAAAAMTANRRAGIDVNVSNLTVASHVDGSDLRVTRIARSGGQRQRARRRARQERRRQRDLDRSRRAMNRDQYQLSKRQAKRARRREAAGLRPQQVTPSGPRKARSDGVPLQVYRKDRLSKSYRKQRTAQVAAALSTSQAKRDHARRVAGGLVYEHGYQLVVEDCHVGGWTRQWGRGIAAFSPGMLLAEVDREVTAVAKLAGAPTGVVRASTHTTALSQHCLCGGRVDKSLDQRVHRCPQCGLEGDRDAVSATLAAFVKLEDRARPSSAFVDYAASAAALQDNHTRSTLRDTLQFSTKGRQDAPSESTAHSACDGSSAAETGRTPETIVVARRIVGMVPRTTPNETGSLQTTSGRARARTNVSSHDVETSTPIRDTS